MGRGTEVYRGRHVIVSFDLDRNGIQAIALGPELRDACRDLVETRALPYARRISPRSDEPHQHYADSFVVEDVLTGLTPEAIGRPPMLRVGARLLNTVRHAAAVEWGNAENRGRGHRVLGRTLDHLNSLGRNHN